MAPLPRRRACSSKEAEPPPLQRGWVRLAVQACGICGSDLDVWSQRYQPVLGLSPGHEFAGTVLQSTAPLPDRLYTASPLNACANCQDCVSGNPQLDSSSSGADGIYLLALARHTETAVLVGQASDCLVNC